MSSRLHSSSKKMDVHYASIKDKVMEHLMELNRATDGNPKPLPPPPRPIPPTTAAAPDSTGVSNERKDITKDLLRVGGARKGVWSRARSHVVR